MSSKSYKQALQALIPLVAVLVTVAGFSQPADAEITTLFSTPQERKIIDANRYKSDTVVIVRVEEEKGVKILPKQIRQQVTVSYMVSGITHSDSGPHYAWINNEVYEDGQRLEDGSQFKVMPGSKIQIRITAPDGKIYYANSGETIDVTYLAVVEDQ